MGNRAGSRSRVHCRGSTDWTSWARTLGVYKASNCPPEVRHTGNVSQREHEMLGKMKLLIVQGCAESTDKEHQSPTPGEIYNDARIRNVAQITRVVNL